MAAEKLWQLSKNEILVFVVCFCLSTDYRGSVRFNKYLSFQFIFEDLIAGKSFISLWGLKMGARELTQI